MASSVLAFTLPAARPWEEPWPWLSAPVFEVRKLFRALESGGVEAVLVDTGAYRLMVRGGARGYPGGFMDYYYGRLLEVLDRSGGARVYYVVPDVPYDPAASASLAGRWLSGFHRGRLGEATPILPLHPACRGSPRCYPRGLRLYTGLLGGFEGPLGLVQVDRGRPSLSAEAILRASALLDGRPLHLLGSTLRLLKSLRGLGCLPGLHSLDTSSWYWDRAYRGVETPLRSYMLRVLSEASKLASCSPVTLEAWLEG